jgi:deoxyribonuclease-4
LKIQNGKQTSMRLGFHLSIAGSLLRAVRQARVLGCQAMQVFVQNPRAWRWRDPPREEITAFVAARRLTGLGPLAVHLTYLPNLAAGDWTLYQKSRERLVRELALARDLQADYLICHPGHGPLGPESFGRVAGALAAAVGRTPPPPLVLLENTAGQGREIGWEPGQLAEIMRLAAVPLGLCLDTSHAWAAGYDLGHAAGVDRLLREIARGPGLDSLKIIHLNDSRGHLGCRRDRHAALGRGAIGLPGFRQFLSHPWLGAEAAIMETPKRHQADEWRNLITARSLISTRMLTA